jgi:hypothetical protein
MKFILLLLACILALGAVFNGAGPSGALAIAGPAESDPDVVPAPRNKRQFELGEKNRKKRQFTVQEKDRKKRQFTVQDRV